MRATLLAIAVLACGCADLAPVGQGTCGNGVLDPGEDCDLPDHAVCSQCSYTCGHCPAGYACSAHDQLCHAPTGVFTKDPTSQFSFPAVTGYVADIDADQIPDLIGLSGSSLTATFGQAQGKLSVQATQVTPILAGPEAFAVRPLAGGGDQLLLGTADGIAGYHPQSGKLLPYPFANPLHNTFLPCDLLNQPGVVPVAAFTYDGDHVNAIARDASGALSFIVLDVVSGRCSVVSACGITATTDDQVYADTYDTSAVTGGSSELVAIDVAPIMPTPAAHPLCVLRVAGAGPAQPVPGAPSAGQGLAKLARLTASPCPWLITGATGLGALAPSLDASGCTLTATTVTFQPATPDPDVSMVLAAGAPVGRVPLDPPVAGLGPEAIAVTTWPPSVFGRTLVLGVHAPGAGNVAAVDDLYASSTPLFTVRSARDASGRVRIAAASAFDVELLQRLGTTPYFGAYRIPTSGSPNQLELLDLDADGLIDLAYAEQAGDGERLEIAWGGSELPEPPQVFAEKLPAVFALIRIAIPDSSDPDNVIPDLAVIDGDPTDLRLVTFHGGPQRTLPTFFDPRTSYAVPSAFATVLSGAFLPHSSGEDVLALQVPVTGNASVWESPGTDDGSLAAPQPSFDTDAGACPGATSLCASSSLFATWPVAASDGTTRDVAIGVDARGRIARLDPQDRGMPQQLATCDPAACPLPDAAQPESWQLHGVFPGDAGAGQELFLIYGPANIRTPTGMVMTCQVSADGVPTSCTQLTYDSLFGKTGKVSALGNQLCTDAISGAFSPPPQTRPDVLLLCRADQASDAVLWKLSADGSSYTASEVRDLADTRFIVFADVTGDGLPDLIAIRLDSSTPLVSIYPQCEHRDLSCLQGGAP